MNFNSKFISIKYDKIVNCRYLEIVFKLFIKEIAFVFNKLDNSYSICIAIR